MLQMNRSIMNYGGLLWFKWLIILTPSVTVIVGHSLLGYLLGYSAGHSLLEVVASRLTENLIVAFLLLVLTYIFVEILFRVIWRLQAQAMTREQDILTMNAVMKERERLSRELHDGVAQLVADLLLRLDTIKDLVETDQPQEAETELERLHEVADEIYEDIGESIAGLRTNVTEQGLIGALQDYIDQFEERHQIPTSLRTDNTADRLAPPAALQVFRFIQEALTNVRKHASAREVTVTFTSNGADQLKIVITDDGRGFTPEGQRNGKARPMGLTSMRERVEALGGSFHVHSQPGSGTQVTATIPIPRKRRNGEHAAFATPTG
jgi:two-component system, NarL family, sensor histidine kinase DegS